MTIPETRNSVLSCLGVFDRSVLLGVTGSMRLLSQMEQHKFLNVFDVVDEAEFYTDVIVGGDLRTLVRLLKYPLVKLKSRSCTQISIQGLCSKDVHKQSPMVRVKSLHVHSCSSDLHDESFLRATITMRYRQTRSWSGVTFATVGTDTACSLREEDHIPHVIRGDMRPGVQLIPAHNYPSAEDIENHGSVLNNVVYCDAVPMLFVFDRQHYNAMDEVFSRVDRLSLIHQQCHPASKCDVTPDKVSRSLDDMKLRSSATVSLASMRPHRVTIVNIYTR